jgi:hypothetical protein
MDLLSSGVSIEKCSTVVRSVLDNLLNVQVDRLPKKSLASPKTSIFVSFSFSSNFLYRLFTVLRSVMMLLTLIKSFASSLFLKSGDGLEFNDFLSEKNEKNYLITFLHNRFNVLFIDGGAVISMPKTSIFVSFSFSSNFLYRLFTVWRSVMMLLTLIKSFASSLFFSLFSSDRDSASSEKVSFEILLVL